MLACICVVLALSSCDEDYTIKFAMWKGFEINPTTVHPGDTIRIKAVLDKGGQYLYKIKYNWTMTVDTINDKGMTGEKELSYSISSSTSRPIHMNDEPSAYFVIPQNVVTGKALHKFTFQADYEHAATGAPVSTQSTAQEGYYGGVFNYQALSTLYSRTTNNFTTVINIE